MPVVITSYEIAIRDRRALQRLYYKYMVVDEGHRLKNSQCRLVRELKAIKADNKLLLTGAPAPCFCADTRMHACRGAVQGASSGAASGRLGPRSASLQFCACMPPQAGASVRARCISARVRRRSLTARCVRRHAAAEQPRGAVEPAELSAAGGVQQPGRL
jgi:SNF2-related domain